jgi:hypothetical protein
LIHEGRLPDSTTVDPSVIALGSVLLSGCPQKAVAHTGAPEAPPPHYSRLMTDLSDLDPTPKPDKYRILDSHGELAEEVEALDPASVSVIARDRKIPRGWTIERLDGETWVFVESFGIGKA